MKKSIRREGDDHMCGLLQYSSYGMLDAAQNWEEELNTTFSDFKLLKLTRGITCPCVWQGCIRSKHIVATVHGDDITIGGERSAVGFHQKDIEKIRDQKASDRRRCRP